MKIYPLGVGEDKIPLCSSSVCFPEVRVLSHTFDYFLMPNTTFVLPEPRKEAE